MLFDATFAAGPAEITEAVRSADAAGFDGLSIAELQHDPFIVATLACAAPTSLRVGTSVAIAFARSPMTVAYQAWDLQRLSGGRFALGIGSQIEPHIARRFGMPWASRPRAYGSMSRRCGRSGPPVSRPTGSAPAAAPTTTISGSPPTCARCPAAGAAWRPSPAPANRGSSDSPKR